MNRKLRALVYVLVACYASHVLALYLPDAGRWIASMAGFVLGCIAVMASILVSDHAEGGPRP